MVLAIIGLAYINYDIVGIMDLDNLGARGLETWPIFVSGFGKQLDSREWEFKSRLMLEWEWVVTLKRSWLGMSWEWL